ncbi:uncharacterized protein BP5553_02764 [Venustampulla echinocandica]|uniref:SWIM-type domain-containing protein n=1 Tax=Venustampulla echinocandica TaxID=2656787 RepID=A0A370TSE3_9HELO|nr:uncharacterized protein BP5553_02764 [Venustampulla echinocandica]RDL38424.1 hypothetical protein BP5553_02764 [Venustampulla echinocandica]
MTTLPTPRHLITSIFNTLTTPHQPPPSTESSNPLKALPPSHRALLTTLHVLFPPGMLLQALDLLDRGLVTKVVYVAEEGSKDRAEDIDGDPVQAHLEESSKSSLYKVQSSQSHHKSRFSSTATTTTATTSSAESYTVHLHAWNCSCAAFAFSAFSATSSAGSAPWVLTANSKDHGGSDDDDDDIEGAGEEWEFGGLGFGRDGDGVPVCKHLLACVLVERWGGVMGGFVKVRRVGREEMAGLGGEG